MYFVKNVGNGAWNKYIQYGFLLGGESQTQIVAHPELIRPIQANRKQIEMLQYVFGGAAWILNTHGRAKLKSWPTRSL